MEGILIVALLMAFLVGYSIGFWQGEKLASSIMKDLNCLVGKLKGMCRNDELI